MKRLISLTLLISNFYSASSQYYFYNSTYLEPPVIIEAGLSGGAINCFTDLGGNQGPGKAFIKDMNLINSKICGGLYLHALYNYIWGCRL